MDLKPKDANYTSKNDLSSFDVIFNGEDIILDADVGVTPLKATSVASNLSGTRLITGSSDGTLRCIDFKRWASDGSGPLWSKTLEQGITYVAISNDDSVIATASGKLLSFYTDGGDFIVHSAKGDMYLLDAKNTKGHTATVTCVVADPNQFNLFASSSIDGTVRVFDLDSNREGVFLSVSSKQIYLPKAGRGTRVPIYSICYTTLNGTSKIVGGTEKGSILIWDCRTHPSACGCVDAYSTCINCIISPDDGKIITRSESLIKLWDLRSLKTSIKQVNIDGGEFNQSLALSPDLSHFAVAETSLINPRNVREGFKGGIKILTCSDLDVVDDRRLKSAPGPMTWAYETDQLFSVCIDGKIWARCGGEVCGAMYASRAKATLKKKSQFASVKNISARVVAYPIDELPDNLEESEDGTLKRKRVPKVFDKPGAQREPFTDIVSHGKTPISYEDEDIVTKLRAMSGETDKVTDAAAAGGIRKIPYKVDKFMAMYKKTQPDLILDFASPETAEENLLLGVRKCPRCGIKICQCGYMEPKS